MAHRARRLGQPNLCHLLILLFISMCIIISTLYYLNISFSESSTLQLSPTPNENDFNEDFRIVPHLLPSSHRILIVLILSHWRHFDRRLTIRNSWASIQHQFNVSVFFVVGDSDEGGIGAVKDEGAFFHDIIQPTVIENYQNIILKILSAFRLIENELDTDFIMKTQDDVYVNLPKIIQFLKVYIPPQKLLFGPVSDPKYNKNPIPVPAVDYFSGSSYIFSFDVMQRFVLCPKVADLVPEENVFFTGICRQHFDLKLQQVANFSATTTIQAPCLWKSRLITVRVVQPEEMEAIWIAVNKKSVPDC